MIFLGLYPLVRDRQSLFFLGYESGNKDSEDEVLAAIRRAEKYVPGLCGVAVPVAREFAAAFQPLTYTYEPKGLTAEEREELRRMMEEMGRPAQLITPAPMVEWSGSFEALREIIRQEIERKFGPLPDVQFTQKAQENP
jgi:hypothetical protein